MNYPRVAVSVPAILASLLVWLYIAAAAPLRLVVLPKKCDTVVLKSFESGGYIGVSMPYTSQSSVRATYSYGDPESRLVVNYFGVASGPMVLTVKLNPDNPADLAHLLLGFDSADAATMKLWSYKNVTSNSPPLNSMLIFGGWPVTNASSLRAGPFYRLYLLADARPYEPRAIVGVDRAGRIELHPMDTAGDTPNAGFVNPTTLFLVNVVSSPGETCTDIAA